MEKNSIKGLMVFLLSILFLNSYAQEQLGNKYTDKKGRPIRYNIIKTNLLGWPFGMYNLAYERKLNKKYSALLQVDIFGTPLALTSSIKNTINSDATYSYSASGFAIYPEVRMYLGKHGAPRGYYFGLYVPIINYKGSLDMNYPISQNNNVSASPATIETEAKGSFSPTFTFYGLGVSGGPQFIIANRVTLEFYLNLAIGTYSISNTELNLSTPLINGYSTTSNGVYTASQLAAMGINVGSNTEDFTYAIQGTPTNKSLNVTYDGLKNALNGFNSGFFVIPRIGFSVGYAFGK